MDVPIWTPYAEGELDDILYYIAVDQRRPETAARLFVEIHEAVEAHLKMGCPGHAHPAMPINCRYFRHKRWLIVYTFTSEGMIVQRIVDASRDLPRQFDRDA